MLLSDSLSTIINHALSDWLDNNIPHYPPLLTIVGYYSHSHHNIISCYCYYSLLLFPVIIVIIITIVIIPCYCCCQIVITISLLSIARPRWPSQLLFASLAAAPGGVARAGPLWAGRCGGAGDGHQGDGGCQGRRR